MTSQHDEVGGTHRKEAALLRVTKKKFLQVSFEGRTWSMTDKSSVDCMCRMWRGMLNFAAKICVHPTSMSDKIQQGGEVLDIKRDIAPVNASTSFSSEDSFTDSGKVPGVPSYIPSSTPTICISISWMAFLCCLYIIDVWNIDSNFS